ncbi:glutathione-disulfide reductase [Methylocapsa sp. D3K7]|uniref:glutathione-disulfide reductase n=1 Tax=Methylocapsa sp. D3K7 TaxID=3041435 RepID=UPI00244EAFA7|nr:glutathione-disulfide reductase [Methylocapsa sp. D3K7]WGJ14592.1 glutathione-disulfide reductase [Methylocapsa sp. D3K7]
MAEYDVDLFVIGAGSGGVRAARVAAAHGARVMIAEEFRVGGTCVIRGCVPKKLLVYASRFKDHFDDAAGFGWTLTGASFDWRKLVAAKENEISRLSAIYRSNLSKAGVAVVDGRAIIEDAHRVRLMADDRKSSAKIILISTGGAPVLEPDIPGREYAITSNEVFDLPSLPKRMLIVGGGYIAVEFASIFARFGTEILLAVRGENVLRGFDDDLRSGVRDGLVHAGVKLHFGTQPVRIEKTAAGIHVSLTKGESLDVEQVMLATGRRPNTAGLGLEKVGVELDHIGAVKVDAFSKTNIESIYAVGDVTNRVALTPVAIREGHAFADTVFGGKPEAVVHSGIPTAVFSTPELGTVGLTETEARAMFDCVDIYMANFRPLKATLSGRAEMMLMKIVVDGATDRVLGVHILGEDASEMAQILGIAVKLGAKKADFDATMALHPTSAEELVTLRTRTARYEREIPGPEGPDSGALGEG